MANSYIPRKQSHAAHWMRTFANGIASDPSRYQLSPADAVAIQSAVQSFRGALAEALDPAISTVVAVKQKDLARESVEQLIQVYYSQIKCNMGVSDADKIAIGVRPLNRNRSKINCPASSPLINVIGATQGGQTLFYRDTNTPSSRSKPFGAALLEVRVAIDDKIVRDVNEAKPAGMFTSNPVNIAFDHEDDRKKATYFARWVSRRGEVGPWSLPVSMSIAA